MSLVTQLRAEVDELDAKLRQERRRVAELEERIGRLESTMQAQYAELERRLWRAEHPQ